MWENSCKNLGFRTSNFNGIQGVWISLSIIYRYAYMNERVNIPIGSHVRVHPKPSHGNPRRNLGWIPIWNFSIGYKLEIKSKFSLSSSRVLNSSRCRFGPACLSSNFIKQIKKDWHQCISDYPAERH